MVANRLSNRRYREAVDRRERFIQLAHEGRSIDEMCQIVGVSRKTYEKWRERDREWYDRFRSTRERLRMQEKAHFDGSFVSFRKRYLGMDTLPYMGRIVDAIEGSQPGEVTLILIPPGHGKTTLLEDWCTFKLVEDPSFRITVGSETVDHAKKILGRVRERLEDEGPTPQIATDFGPFSPREGRSSQPWGATHFNTYGKRASDERDYSMNTVGLTGRVQGTRCDLLLLDDIQDVKSIEQSKKYCEIVRQSFLSRPEMFGRTVIIGTRVGEFDVYRMLMDADIPDHVVTIPAYDTSGPTWSAPVEKPAADKPHTYPPEGVRFLWGPNPDGLPYRYTPLQYAKLRYRVGEKAWWRNYMQRPEAATTMTFSEDITERMKDTGRGIWVTPSPTDTGNKVPIIISLDPAVGGGNATGVGAVYANRLEVQHCRLDYNLTSYSQIFQILGEYCWRFTTAQSKVIEIVIEDKAFQKGLLTADQLIELQGRYGFRVVPNTTGREKVDPDIGIPAMPESIIRGEITIPWGNPEAELAMGPLLDHLHIWRPGVNGVKLPQDMTMMLFFMWRRWKAYRDTPLHSAPSTTQFSHAPSPLRAQGFRPRSHSRR